MKAAQFNKNYANKEGFKTLLWCGVGVLFIMFFTQITRMLKGFFGLITGSTSAEEIMKKNEAEANKVDALISSSGYSGSSLPRPISHYDNIADSLENYMQGWGTNSKKMYELLAPLSANELKAVYLKFGSRVNEDFSNDAGNLFTWFDWELSDYSPFDLGAASKMRTLWKKTGLPLTF
jgi:hypothetical protein